MKRTSIRPRSKAYNGTICPYRGRPRAGTKLKRSNGHPKQTRLGGSRYLILCPETKKRGQRTGSSRRQWAIGKKNWVCKRRRRPPRTVGYKTQASDFDGVIPGGRTPRNNWRTPVVEKSQERARCFEGQIQV